MKRDVVQNLTRAGYCRAIVVGASAGGADALRAVLAPLPEDFGLPILVAQHLHSSDDGMFFRHLLHATRLTVSEPCDKEIIKGGCVYTAPANYHMLVEREKTIALSIDAKVNWSRPSIDVLFQSAARVWGQGLVAILLTGANCDGSEGLRVIKEAGGQTIAQNPTEALVPVMPQAAIDAGVADMVMGLADIAKTLLVLGSKTEPKLSD